MAESLAVSKGPYAVDSEEFKLLDLSGEDFKIPKGEKIFLCGCGSSENRPYCGGARRKVGFQYGPSGVRRPRQPGPAA